MPITDIFSKRQKRMRGDVPDVYQYETIPRELRVQVVRIIDRVFRQMYPYFVNIDSFDIDLIELGHHQFDEHIELEEKFDRWHESNLRNNYEQIYELLCQEYGALSLGNSDDPCEAVRSFLIETSDTEKAIDVMEVSFRFMERYINAHSEDTQKYLTRAAISELNHRFLEHGVGYQYESGQIIRIDSQFIHAEIVRPALHLLSASIFKSANDEFLRALQSFQKQEWGNCVTRCANSLESVMKIVCKEKGWEENPDKLRAARLLRIVVENSNLDPYYVKLLELPHIIRNEKGGVHGTSEIPTVLPEHIAQFVVNMTASSILLLVAETDP